MLYASDVPQLVLSSKLPSRALWLIQNVGIPALYVLGRLAYQDRQWAKAASFLEIALTHATNLSMMISTCRVSDETKPLTSPTTAALQIAGGILNARGVVHYRWSVACATENGNDASAVARVSSSHFYLTESLPLVREESLPLVREDWGGNSPTVATVLNNLGRLWLHCINFSNEFPSAPLSVVGYLDRAVTIRRRRLDPNCLDTAVSLCNLGRALFQMGHVTCALARFGECVQHPAMQQLSHFDDDGAYDNEWGTARAIQSAIDSSDSHFSVACFIHCFLHARGTSKSL